MQLQLFDLQLARTQLVAPFAGVVVSGDLSQRLGSPVERGEVLFEVAPLDEYRVVLEVDERDIPRVEVGDVGSLALAAMPGKALALSVSKVTPVSTVAEGRNLFRVEAQIDEAPAFLRPGMKGVGKIDVGRRRLIWIWTHELVDWLRLQLWLRTADTS